MAKKISDARLELIIEKDAMLSARGLLVAELPKIKGKEKQFLRDNETGKVIVRPIRRSCPFHGEIGVETDWKPEEGADPDWVEFSCPRAHAFYASCLPVNRIPRRKAAERVPLLDKLPEVQGQDIGVGHARHRRCPWHPSEKSVETGWHPPEGVDQRLREFHCPKGHGFYRRV